MVAFTGSVPANYHRYLRDLFFLPYAQDLAARLKLSQDGRLLEIASGTGILTRTIAKSFPRVTIVATDLNEAMIVEGRRQADLPRVSWRQADAMNLPFADGEFDAVVCQFGLMFVPDKPAALRECRRVLRPGGQLAFNVWDSLAENDFSQTFNDFIQSRFPADPPRFMEIPFSWHDRGEIEQFVRGSGFADISLIEVPLPCSAPSATDVASGLALGTPMFDSIKERGVDAASLIGEAARELAARYGDHPIRGRMQAIVTTARAS